MRGYHYEDLSVGMTGEYARTVTEADIVMFAGITGDTNPVHLNQIYAESTIFKTRIAHGSLLAGYISCILGTIMPGPGCIYLSQTLRFKAPVRIGDTVVATVTVVGKNDEKKRLTCSTTCMVGERTVLEGEAVVIAPSRA
ncbi:MAG: MaoC family dehydratase [Alphaproteobacteria bacterium]|nr:MaoC family dehydratase [Alphaproteobacteria bacterium]